MKCKFWLFKAKISQNKEDQERIFVGPQITQLYVDQDFSTQLNFTERRALKAFQNAGRTFWAKKKKISVKLCRG